MADHPNVHTSHIETIGFTDLDNGNIMSEVSEIQPIRTDVENDENVAEEDIENPDEKYTYRPVITVTKNEVTLTKTGSKLQKITVKESLGDSVDNSSGDVEDVDVRLIEYLGTDNERKIISEAPDEPCELRTNKSENIKEDNTSNTEIHKPQTKICKESSGENSERKNENEKPEIEVKEREEEVIYNKPISKLPKRVTPKNAEAPKMEVSNKKKEEKCNRIATSHIFLPSNTYEGRANIFSETPTGPNLLRHEPPSKMISKIQKNNKNEDKTYSKIPKLSKSEHSKITKEPKEKTYKDLKEKTSKTEVKLPTGKTVKPLDSKNEKKNVKEPKEKSGKTSNEKILKIITIIDTDRPEVHSDVPMSPHDIRDFPIGFKEENNQSEVVHRPPKVIRDKDREFYPVERNSVIIDQIINSQVPDEIDDIFEELYDSLAPEKLLDDEVELAELSVNETAKEDTNIDIISADKPNVHTICEENVYLNISKPCKNVSNEEVTINNEDAQSNSTIIKQDLLFNKDTNINYAIPTTEPAVVKENHNDEIEQDIDEVPTAPTVANNNQEHLKTKEQSEISFEQNSDESNNNFLKPGVIVIVCDKGESFMEKRKQFNRLTEPALITETETIDSLSENINERNKEGVPLDAMEGHEKHYIDDKLETSTHDDQPYKSLDSFDIAIGQEQVIDPVFENQYISLQHPEESKVINNEKYNPGEYLENYPICKENTDIVNRNISNIKENVQTSPKVASNTNISTKDRGETTEYFEAKNDEILKSNITDFDVNIPELTPENLENEIKSEYGFDEVNVEDFNAQESIFVPVKTTYTIERRNDHSSESSKVEVLLTPEIPENIIYKQNGKVSSDEVLLSEETAINHTESEFPKNIDEHEIYKGDSDEKALSKDIENEELEDNTVLTMTKETVFTIPNTRHKITLTEGTIMTEDPFLLFRQTPKEEIETSDDEKVNEPISPIIDLSRPNHRDTVKQKMKEISDRSSFESNQTETKRDIKQKEHTEALQHDFKSKDIHKPKIVDHLTKKDAKERDSITFDNYIKKNTEINKENEIYSNDSNREIEKIEIKGKVKQMINRIVNKKSDDDVKNDVKVEHKNDKPEEVLKGKVQNVLQRFESREELSEPKKAIEEPKPVNKKFQNILNKFENKSDSHVLFEEDSKKERKIQHKKTFKNEEDLAKEAIKGKVQNILKEIESKKDQTVLAKGKSMENIFSNNLDYRREFVRRKSLFEVGNV